MMRYINILFSLIRFIFHIIVYYRSDRTLLDYESEKWLESHHLSSRKGIRAVLYLLASYPEYRSLYYFRTGAYWLNRFAKGQNNLEFYMPSDRVGKGLIIWHGFSTVINAETIGEDCQIWQNVTIGKKYSFGAGDKPIIGSNVRITSGSIVIGEVHLADNVCVASGAVVVKDVPTPGTIVASQPSRYIIPNGSVTFNIKK